jgi:hypothetical protein
MKGRMCLAQQVWASRPVWMEEAGIRGCGQNLHDTGLSPSLGVLSLGSDLPLGEIEAGARFNFGL